MTFPPPNPADRPDPLENMPAVRARVPEHVASGEISTGVIVVTGGTEYVLDFVRNLPRPNCVVSRVVLPHLVMPQFIDALTTNIELFRQRYGDLPGMMPAPPAPANGNSPLASPNAINLNQTPGADGLQTNSHNQLDSQNAHPENGALGGSGAASGNLHAPPETNSPETNSPAAAEQDATDLGGTASAIPGPPTQTPRRQNPQEVYDDLKIRDEILSGAYANAVMIGHGPYEFSFDFITQFYPQPAVSARVFMASGHVFRLLESLKTSWEQIRGRYGYPPKD